MRNFPTPSRLFVLALAAALMAGPALATSMAALCRCWASSVTRFS